MLFNLFYLETKGIENSKYMIVVRGKREVILLVCETKTLLKKL